MPSTYTLNNGIELIATGEQSGTWGDTTNTNLSLIDTALDGQVTITLASAGTSGSPNTLPISDGSASNGRNRLVIFADGGDLGATAFVQLTPNDAKKIVYIRNNLSGGRAITLFQGAYNASNDYVVPAGTTAVVFFNGGGAGAVAANVFNNAFFDSLRLGGVSVTAILDEDDMASNSATALATQQSIKAYVDAQVGANNELSEVLANGNTSGGTNIQMTTTDEVQFRDSGLKINSSVDGQLDIDADVELEVTAPTVDINASTAVTIDTSTMTMTGSVNVVGDLDVDNLNLNGNAIVSTNTNGNIALTPNGTGEVDISKVDIDGGTIDGTVIGGASAAAGSFTTLNTSGDVVFNEAGADVNFRVESDTEANALFVDGGTGNVGIATSSPTGNLTIGGVAPSIHLLETGGSAGFNNTVLVRDADSYIIQTRNGATFVSSDYVMTTNASGATAHAWRIGNSEKMRINSSGNVGIGTSSPATALDVAGTVTADGLTVNSSGATYFNASVDGATGLTTLKSTNNSTGGSLKIQTGGSDRFTISANGDISFYEDTGTTAKFFWDASAQALGIGTTSPTAKLTTVGAGVMARFNTGAAVDGRVEFAHNSTDIAFLSVDSATEFSVQARSGRALKLGAGGAERMRITSTGNVGIGTSSPTARLDLGSSLGQKLQLYSNNFVRYGLGVESGELRAYSPDSAVISFGGVSSADGTTFSERMRITSTGNVGIGTSSPTSKLTVAGAGLFDADDAQVEIKAFSPSLTFTDDSAVGAAADKFIIQSVFGQSLGDYEFVMNNDQTGSANVTVVKFAGNGDISFYEDTGTTPKFFWDASAEALGIGTTSPAAKLHIEDDAGGAFRVENITNTSFVSSLFVDDAGNGLTITSYGSAYAAGSLLNVGAGGVALSSTTDMAINAAGSKTLRFGTANLERVRIDSLGNVGIGTSSPASKLTVDGAGEFKQTSSGGEVKPLRVTNSSTTTGSSASLVFNLSTVSADQAKIEAKRTNSPISSDTELNFYQFSNGTMTLRQKIATNGDISFYEDTGTTPKFFWDASAEALGIGTSSIAQTLHINSAAGVSTAIKLTNGTSGTALTDGFSITQSSDGVNTSIWNYESGYIRFGTANTERMRITSTGNVGIGTSSPASPLHASVTTSGTNDIQTVLTIERQTSGTAAAGLGSRISFLGELNTGFTGAQQAGVVAGWSDPAGGGVNDGYLAFETTLNNSSAERMRINSSGNVGIGTSSPQMPLTVNGVVQAIDIAGVSIANGATATVLTPPRGYSYVNVSTGAGTAYGLLLLVFRSTTTLTIVSTVDDSTSADYSASVSGTALQVTNSYGSTQTFYASCVNIGFGTGN